MSICAENSLLRLLTVGAVLASLAGCASSAGSGRNNDPARVGSSVERVSPVRAAEANTRLGVGYLEQGKLQIALEKLELAVHQDPKHAPAHLALGIIYQSIGRNDTALYHMKTAVALAPEDGSAHNNYAVLLCRVGRFPEADREFLKALEDPFYQTPEVVLANAGSCARRWGESERAERYLREALTYDPAFGEALFSMSELSFDQGRLLPARGFLQRLESQGELTPEALLLAVRIERALGNEATAQQYASRLRSRHPGSAEVETLKRDKLN